MDQNSFIRYLKQQHAYLSIWQWQYLHTDTFVLFIVHHSYRKKQKYLFCLYWYSAFSWTFQHFFSMSWNMKKHLLVGETHITFKPTEVRNDPNVVYYYIFLAQNFARVFIPGIMLVFFNGNVIWKLYQKRKTISK